jgi:hypothetical protein
MSTEKKLSDSCATCGRPRGLEQLRGSWGISPNPWIPRTENPEDHPWQSSNDMLCQVMVYRNGGIDSGTHLCNECLRVALRAMKVEVSDVLNELDAGHDKEAELASVTERLARLQERLHRVCFDHNRMQDRLRDLLAHKSESADAEVVRMAEFEAARPKYSSNGESR